MPRKHACNEGGCWHWVEATSRAGWPVRKPGSDQGVESKVLGSEIRKTWDLGKGIVQGKGQSRVFGS